jgi:L-ascorbate metabolism protein UlaG (beta-lactamase superfamily)
VEITALGHAGLQVSGSRTAGLVDPWFDPAGAFLGSWHPFPDNRHLLRPGLLTPDWVAISSDGDDRMDPTTLVRIPSGTPVFVPAGNRRLAHRLAAATRLRVVAVPPCVPVKLDESGSHLAFLPPGAGGPSTSSIVISVDRVSLLVCASTPPTGAQLHDIRARVGDRFDVAAIQIARPARDLFCEEAPASVLRRRAAELRTAALEAACATIRAAQPGVVLPYGGPPCFLDPELAHLNRWISPAGVLPDIEQVAELLRADLPGQRVTTLLPGDRFFPAEDLVVDDPRWRGFSFARLRGYLHDYAHARAVDLSRVHSRFPPPDESLGPRFAAHVARLAADRPALPRVGPDHLRFEVTGPGGGAWDVVVDGTGATVDLTSRATTTIGRIRIASKWLAAAVDGRVAWSQLLRSFRYSVARVGDRDDDPVLEFLEQDGSVDDDALTPARAAP